jgi:hypothetical protein
MKKRDAAGWLALAVRHRQWQVEQQMPELKESLAVERQAEAAQAEAETVLAGAHAARGAVLASATFGADALMRHALYAGRLHEALVDAREAAGEAREQGDRMRAQAQGLLAERDAYQQRLDRSLEESELEATRRVSRDHDELWLLRGGAAAAGERANEG